MKRHCYRAFWLSFTLIILISGIPTHATAQDFPPLEVTVYDSSSTSGYYFIVPYTIQPPYDYVHPQLILDKYGRVVYSRIFSELAINISTTSDFKIHDNGIMSYFSRNSGHFFLMDSTFTVIDSVGPASGFAIDSHDLLILPNGHFMLMAKDVRIMDMSAYSWFGPSGNLPGSTTAEVTGVAIQEFDENKNLVWEWLAHDHFDIEDVDTAWLKGPNKVDWTHSNAIEVDTDGNILLSSRHFNEITKINRETDEIIWRMGGKANQFTFTNDSLWFNGQHDIRRLENGEITLYDNGKYHFTNPPIALARALNYSLDETNLIATLTWEYFVDSTANSKSLGNYQTLENGNRLIDFGTITEGFPWMVLVKPDKSVIMEINSPGTYQSYRAFNYETMPWPFEQPLVDCYKDGDTYYLEAEAGHQEYLWSTGATTQSIPVNTTGEYWVSVPHGDGSIRSRHINITDISNPCLYLNTGKTVDEGTITLQCLPNPVSSVAKISFGIPTRLNLSLHLTDMTGKELFSIPATTYEQGSHIVSYDVSHLSSGIYLLRLQAAGTSVMRKVVIQ